LGPAATRAGEIPLGGTDPSAIKPKADEAATAVGGIGDAATGTVPKVEAMTGGWISNLEKIRDKAIEAAAAVAALAKPSADPSAPPDLSIGDATVAAGAAGQPTMQAAGGYIRGAGSGTSDSILARLSNGEFVINSGSVRRLGVGFLQGLNNYAMGGLVGMPHFAEGGLAAGGGTPVHLHLGGPTFATTAASSVASALVSEAHRQAVSSAGVKPSWYGGRPGGR
jgi:hypothetical protein